jgi:lipoate-protein ligase A
VRRALVTAPGWRDFDWEIVHEKAVSPRMNLALDEVLTTRVGEGRRKPTLRIWEWNESAVVIGSFQSYRNEVDPEARRGTASTSSAHLRRRRDDDGRRFDRHLLAVRARILVAGHDLRRLLRVPRRLGAAGAALARHRCRLPAAQRHRLAGGKIGGAAQKRLANGGVLHHATLSYDMDGQVMTEVLRIGREKLSDKGTVSAAKRVDPLRSQTGCPRGDHRAFVQTFSTLYGAEPGHITEEEYAEAEALVEEKFSTDAWLHRVP